MSSVRTQSRCVSWRIIYSLRSEWCGEGEQCTYESYVQYSTIRNFSQTGMWWQDSPAADRKLKALSEVTHTECCVVCSRLWQAVSLLRDSILAECFLTCKTTSYSTKRTRIRNVVSYFLPLRNWIIVID